MRKSIYLFLAMFVLVSCNSNNDFDFADETGQDPDTNFVDMREAIALATLLEFDIEEPGGLRSTTYLEVEETIPIGSDEKPSYYVVNYVDNSGFVIIAADKRAESVLAYSTENGFDTDMDDMPGGLVEWMASADGYIHDLREGNIEQEEASTLRSTTLCNALKSVSAIKRDDCVSGNGCPADSYSSESVGPLLTTQWHQGPGFNDLAPYCSFESKVMPAGCVAIAVAQVMNYHKYPTSYNWSSINTTSGGGDAPRLIKDLNTSKNLNMDYGCDGSGASMNDVPRTFKNFGYSSATKGSYNLETLKNQLRYKLPVILSGSRGTGLGFLGIAWQGHAWVCDGFRSTNSCTYSYLSLHMNWGWGGREGDRNGWYDAGEFWKPRNTDYNYEFNHDMIYYIKP